MSVSLVYPSGDTPPRPPIAAIVAAEADHRIANSLAIISSLVRMHASSIVRRGRPVSVDEVTALLDEVAARIAAVGHLHRMMARAERGGSIDLGVYLRDIAEGLSATISSRDRVEPIRFALHTCPAPAERALWIGLIVGEAITNAIKYSHPSGVAARIVVGCRKLPGGFLAVDVRDDGVGLPEGFDPKRDGGLGLRLLRSLTERLQGRIDFDDVGLGLHVRLVVPERALD